MAKGITIALDRGGTFCDTYAQIPGRSHPLVFKILSVDPSAYPDAPTEAIRRVLSVARGKEIPRGHKIDLDGVEAIRMGTTVATNALLERKGEAVAFMVTKGFKDLLLIGDQSRPDLFDLSVNRPQPLPSITVEVNERVSIANEYQTPGLAVIQCSGTDRIQVEKPLDEQAVEAQLRQLRVQGFRSLAVSLLHSYIWPEHEEKIGEIATKVGFLHVSLSSRVSQMVKVVSRSHSAAVDAYLTPELQRNLSNLLQNFTNVRPGIFQFMESGGGLVAAENFSGLRAILSGPAGGVCGYAATCYDKEDPRPVVGFDMGGTSTDVSRYDGTLEHILETKTAGVIIQSPQLDINTVAAGGGSCLKWQNGLFAVGPESAGAHPGPCCYRKGGPLTVTDANLLLGRIVPEAFPKVFGKNESEGLDVNAVHLHFTELADEISRQTGRIWKAEEIAEGFLNVANENMSQPVRALTEAKGHSLGDHNLAVFGGAGGQQACWISRCLDIETVILHRHSSILSAYGIAVADVVQDSVETFHAVYDDDHLGSVQDKVADLEARVLSQLTSGAQPFSSIDTEVYLNLRYEGTDTSLMVKQSEKDSWAFLAAFEEHHRREFGFVLQGRRLFVEEVRVRAVGQQGASRPSNALSQRTEAAIAKATVTTLPAKWTKPVYFGCSGGWTQCPIYLLDELAREQQTNDGTLHLRGPCILLDKTQTIVVAPGFDAAILPEHVVLRQMRAASSSTAQTPVAQLADVSTDAVTLSIMAAKFMSIAERMGQILQRTSVSVNIKERLDFSCSIFSPSGDLVANAPHVPAMLGSMAFAVKYQMNLWKGDLHPGDVLLSNHPIAGGVHLPDMTVVTPVFDDQAGPDPIFFLASRGHHADVGGILPGSMPPQSKFLYEEGAPIESFKIVNRGQFQEDGLKKLLFDDLVAAGQQPTRTLADNISDIRAQIAACHKGAELLNALVTSYGLDCVQKLMTGIQKTAELAVRKILCEFAARRQWKPVTAVDYMDDGTPIQLTVTISKTGEAIFDFTGTGPEVLGNWNAPTAICYSSVIYCLRSMLGTSIPLNQGCLDPITLIIPPKSLLAPSRDVAVCGGNVLTSQRITDVVLKAFEACAASQGCMNNLTFGYQDADGSTLGFYETICGGSGAGPTWRGTPAVQCHMTNTRIGDPEVMERRYPVIVRRFEVRADSGGSGLHRGGDGAIREIEFRRPVTCSILSERRSRAPWGLAGGGDAKCGLNFWRRWDEETQSYLGDINMGGKNSAAMKAKDRILIMTPGGGGWGSEDAAKEEGESGQMDAVARALVPVWQPRASGSIAERSATQATCA
ncbi:hypothetical protein BCV69DRAFT_285620 [Microstroma glucosiphilum]|uniref:5-oxoprolinase n=1 Tax=Pseudomicrostroma glucosiphilum TaxID=1684307 RepID=A0A316U0G4_9BASI|nr:hypothetical protein BCV69DRAFT_285620 [Pseudomicrostroma glucosiphilum]PWN18021.1 hypothetical protein BCV69DRAFT_285620 [Pseudomicrostroma glucosiphilum]